MAGYQPRFGLAIGVSRRESLGSIARFAAEGESLGFGSLWVQDNPLTTRDPYIALTVIAGQTSALRLGPGVSTGAIRHPAVIANSILTLNDESNGRAFLGIGSGGPSLVEPLGMSSRRANEFRKELAAISALLRGEEVVTDTEHYRLGATPTTPVPIFAAASGDMMLRAAGALADGVLLAGPALVSRYLDHLAKAAGAATKAGRDPAKLQACILLNMAIDTETNNASDQLKPFVASWVHNGTVSADSPEMERFASDIAAIKEKHDPSRHLAAGADSALVPDELVRLAAVAGTPDECRRRLSEILALEPAEIVFTIPARERVDTLRSVASVISPLVGGKG